MQTFHWPKGTAARDKGKREISAGAVRKDETGANRMTGLVPAIPLSTDRSQASVECEIFLTSSLPLAPRRRPATDRTSPSRSPENGGMERDGPCVYYRFGMSSVTVAHGTTDRAISVLGNVATIELPRNATNLTIPVLIVDDDCEGTGRRSW